MRRYVLMGLLLGIVLTASIATPALAVYAFGGRILAIFPPILSPCFPAPAILVGPPRGGVFIIPPAKAYNYGITVGAWAAGKALAPSCGPIFMIGTSLPLGFGK